MLGGIGDGDITVLETGGGGSGQIRDLGAPLLCFCVVVRVDVDVDARCGTGLSILISSYLIFCPTLVLQALLYSNVLNVLDSAVRFMDD